MRKILKYIVLICIGVLLSMGYLREASIIINIVTQDGISFTDRRIQTLVIMIMYIIVIFLGILILLNAISKRWER